MMMMNIWIIAVDDDDECLDNCRSSDETYYCNEEPEMKLDTK